MRCPRCFRKLAAGAACPADGSPPIEDERAPVEPPPPPEVPGWRLLAPIAAGGQAAVWRGERAGVVAAIKVAHVGGPEVVAGFAREAAAQDAVGAPTVAALYERGTTGDGRPYLAMELVGGVTLGDHLAHAPGPAPLDDVVGWLAGLAAALAALERAGWVHGDLKPDNVVREPDGRIRLLDLGMAVSVRGPDPAITAGGTALYMAPEQLRGEPVTAATDRYAFGAIGFELATTRPPFVGDRAAIELGHLSFRAPRAAMVRPVPVGLDELLARCLAKAPAARPADAAALAAALGAIDGAALVSRAAPVAVGNRSSVALVAVERAPSNLNLEVEARRRGGVVARQAGGRTLLAFSPDDCPAPVPAALATAAALAAVDARVVVHVAQVAVRRGKDGRVMLFGPALERPDWLPPPAPGVVVTAAAARELDPGELEPIDGASRLRERPVDAAPEPVAAGPIFGRDPIVASARGSAAAALGDGPPAIWVAVGGPGSGKSRLADELVADLGRRQPEAAVVRLAGARTLGAGAATVLASLGAQLAAIAAPPPTAAPLPLTAEVRAAVEAVLAERPLAIVVDDAHWIDEAVLAALAVAARASTGPLWLAATATDALVATAPAWLDGARVTVETLGPLDDADARLAMRRALTPVRRVPETLVARLAARSGGVPGVIAALGRELRRSGVIRRHPGSEVWFVAADELDFLPPTPGVMWFATRMLAALPPGVAELTRAIALFGGEFTPAEVDAITAASEAGVNLDPVIGLTELVARGVVVEVGGAYRFRSEAEQGAIADTVPAATQRALHGVALAHAQREADAIAALPRIAYHAARAGHGEVAAAAAEALAKAALARHAPLEAERWWTLAIEQLGDGDPHARQRLLGARGATRRLLTHYESAQVDLRAARALAEAHGDLAAAIDLTVADGAVCDFTERLGESARLIEEAAARAPADLPAPVRAHLDNWLGVVRARQERLPEARALLEAAIAAATTHGDHTTAIGSMLMLGGVLRRLGAPHDGLAVLDRAIALCDAVGDHFHLTYGLFNRVNIWRQLERNDAAAADAERAIAIANRMGLDLIELWGWYDLSLLRFWGGDLAGALDAASASHRIGSERLRAAPPVVTSVWHALLLAAAGERAAARRELDHVRADDLGGNPFLVLTRDLAELACGDALGAAWDDVVAQSQRATADPEDAFFVWWLRARVARRLGDDAEVSASGARAEAAARALGRAPVPLAWPGEA